MIINFHARILVYPAVKHRLIINRPTIESICSRDAAVVVIIIVIVVIAPFSPFAARNERTLFSVAGMVQIYISI